jgi:hypothetical protein
MQTKTVNIGDFEYTLAPLDWDQYEETVYDESGIPLKRAKLGLAVKRSLENATKAGAVNPEFVPAGHVLELWKYLLDLSGLKIEAAGEAPAAAAQ